MMKWENYERNPILDLGPKGAFDELLASWGSLLREANSVLLYYSGKDAQGRIRICLATSTDGRNFTRIDKRPILEPGSEGSWDDLYTYCPVVWKERPDVYRMIYTGCDKDTSHYQVGLAESKNGIDWMKSEPNPVFNDRNPILKNRWGRHETEAWGVWRDESGYYLLYNSVTRKPRQILVARSDDLLSWKPASNRPLIASEGKKNDIGFMKYCATVYKHKKHFYIASAVSDENYAKSAIGLWKFEGLTPKSNRVFLGYVLSTQSEWNTKELDTPFIVSRHPDSPLVDCYYGGRSSDNRWRLGVATGLLDVTA